jgi:dienelactone hydrolase
MSESLAPLEIPALPLEHWGDRLLTQISGAVDGTVLQAARLAVDAVLMPRPDAIPAMRATAARFLEGELRRDPRLFLAFADEPIEPASDTCRQRRVLPGGAVLSRRFVVPYTPFGEGSGTTEAHDTVRVEHWMHDDSRSRPTVLALHGFSMGYPRFDAVALFAGELYRSGLDVALMTLPYHGRRAPADSRFSGEQFTATDIGQLNEAMRRAAYEIQAVATWLRRHRGGPVGLIGISLGGYLASLMAALVQDLDFVVPLVPPVCIGDLAWRFFARSRHYGASREPAFSHEELRTAYRVHSPLTYRPVVDKERLLILAGRGDKIVPPEHPHALWKHWDEPSIHWFSGSHLAPFRRGRMVKLIVDHIDSCT